MRTTNLLFQKTFPTFIPMVLLFITGLLFIFISVNTGLFFNRFLRIHSPGFLSAILTGTAGLTAYLNILSLFLPANFWLLIPPFVTSVVIFFQKNIRNRLRQMFKMHSTVLLAKNNAIVTVALLAVILLFTIVPPYNTDSSGYHFLAILWNEQFRAVPGLANLFPQYGYNSSFFVLSAAFSFTNIFHQSIYPVNLILSATFLLWMLRKAFNCSGYKQFIYWVMLFVLLRQFPINLASPSADNLASMLVLYIFFTLLEMDIKIAQLNQYNYLILLASFAVIIKLSTVPLLLVALIPLVSRRVVFRDICKNYGRLIPLMMLIILPWFIRNILLSGYLIFPFPSINLFSFDWKVPVDVATIEKLHISQVPRMISNDWAAASKIPFTAWFPTWLQHVWADNRFNFLLIIAGLVSPLFLLFLSFFKNKKPAGLTPAFFIAYTGVWFWLITSPDIRFGYHYLLPCIGFPLLAFPMLTFTKIRIGFQSQAKSVLQKAISFSGLAIIIYYSIIAISMLRPYKLTDCLIKPFKSPEYYKNKNLQTFKYSLLNNDVKLYIHDSLHHSVNVPLPSCSPYRSGISMRGNKLQDGFKTQP